MPCGSWCRRIVIGVTSLVPVVGLLLAGGPVVSRAAEPSSTAAESAPFIRRADFAPHYYEMLLGYVPELNLDNVDTARPFRDAYSELVRERRAAAYRSSKSSKVKEEEKDPLASLLTTCEEEQAKVWATQGLSAREKKQALLADDAAKALADTASVLRRDGMVSIPGRKGRLQTPEGRLSLSRLESVLKVKENEKIPSRFGPALIQMLQTEGEPSRLLLVEALARMDGPTASAGLAQRAVFDISAKVRQAAVTALGKRPAEEYRQILLDGLRYPWPMAANHAAEALVNLDCADSLPALRKMTDEPDPSLPFRQADGEKKWLVKEVVRVNHLRNCVLCHAPMGTGKGLVVAPVPTPGQPLPVAYYSDREALADLFVRADTTYLRQDFSLTQFVPHADPWPEQQRFDFLVRTRAATPEEVEFARKPLETYPQRDAVLWAIAELEERAKAKQPKE
jgi:hypothetical protein